MKEDEWTFRICEKLQKELQGDKLYTEVKRKIPYSQEILSYNHNWEVNFHNNYLEQSGFETDLIIYEKSIEDKANILRVIIEAKYETINTHDAITYSKKAQMHKSIMPYIRYGIILGKRKHYPLPGRLFRHGANFDFMFSFQGDEPTDDEWFVFCEMIRKEVSYSRLLQEMLYKSRNKNRKHYFMLQKQLILEEIPSLLTQDKSHS